MSRTLLPCFIRIAELNSWSSLINNRKLKKVSRIRLLNLTKMICSFLLFKSRTKSIRLLRIHRSLTWLILHVIYNLKPVLRDSQCLRKWKTLKLYQPWKLSALKNSNNNLLWSSLNTNKICSTTRKILK